MTIPIALHRRPVKDTGRPRQSSNSNKSLNWPSWFRHFRAVADVHGWSKEQRALQLVSYLDETGMNVAQELGDNDLYNYDVLVKLLGDRFDPASRVLASRSRFHARSRRHHQDADAFADALAVMPGRLPAKSAGTTTRTDCGAVCEGSIGSGTQKVPLGGHPDPER